VAAADSVGVFEGEEPALGVAEVLDALHCTTVTEPGKSGVAVDPPPTPPPTKLTLPKTTLSDAFTKLLPPPPLPPQPGATPAVPYEPPPPP
jgi:hypothetical protein